MPVGVESDIEVLEFCPGDVALDPYPAWSNEAGALESVARLLRSFHDATVNFPIPQDAEWSEGFADPQGGPVICHNDVCIENVVFEDQIAASLIDFDFAAPGRRVWDIAHSSRYWVPLTDPTLPATRARNITDPIGRLRRFVDAYGLDDRERAQFVDVALEAEHVARTFVEEQVALGVESFVQMWTDAAKQRFEAKIGWIDRHASGIAAALG